MARLAALLAVVAVPVVLAAQSPAPPAEPRFEAAPLKINRSMRVDVVAKAERPAPLSALQRMLIPLLPTR